MPTHTHGAPTHTHGAPTNTQTHGADVVKWTLGNRPEQNRIKPACGPAGRNLRMSTEAELQPAVRPSVRRDSRRKGNNAS